MSTLFNEEEADAEVIRNLSNEISKLRSYLMPIVKTVDGKFYRVEADQEVSAEDVQAKATELQAESAELTALLAPADPAPTNEEQPTDGSQDTPATPDDGGSADAPAEDSATPAEPVDAGEAAAEVPAAETETPAQAEEVAAPATETPITLT